MKEIEIKLQIVKEDAFYSILKEDGFQHSETKILHDKYFGHTESMSNSEQLFRIRNVNLKGTLTLKDGIEDENGVWTRRELNVNIADDSSQMIDILVTLGLKEIKENKSKRDIWHKDSITVEIIEYTIPAKLNLVEIESDSKENVDKIVELLGDSVKIVGEEIFLVFDKASK